MEIPCWVTFSFSRKATLYRLKALLKVLIYANLWHGVQMFSQISRIPDLIQKIWAKRCGLYAGVYGSSFFSIFICIWATGTRVNKLLLLLLFYITGAPRFHYYIPISFEYIPQIHYLNYPHLVPCWRRTSVGRAPVDLIRRLWVQTPLGPNFLWPVGTPKFPLKGQQPRGIWCIGSIAYYRHLNN